MHRREFLTALLTVAGVAAVPQILLPSTRSYFFQRGWKKWDAEDISDLVYNINPQQTPFLSHVSVSVSEFGTHRIVEPVPGQASSLGKYTLTEAHLKRVIQDCWASGGAPSEMWANEQQFVAIQGSA